MYTAVERIRNMDFPFTEPFNGSMRKLFVPVEITGSLAPNVSAVSTVCVCWH